MAVSVWLSACWQWLWSVRTLMGPWDLGREERRLSRQSARGSNHRASFSEDKLFLRRLAYVESSDGSNPDTFRSGYHGGIWQVTLLTMMSSSATKLLLYRCERLALPRRSMLSRPLGYFSPPIFTNSLPIQNQARLGLIPFPCGSSNFLVCNASIWVWNERDAFVWRQNGLSAYHHRRFIVSCPFSVNRTVCLIFWNHSTLNFIFYFGWLPIGYQRNAVLRLYVSAQVEFRSLRGPCVTLMWHGGLEQPQGLIHKCLWILVKFLQNNQ